MASASPSFHLAGYDYVAAIDFGTWGTAVAVCPASEEFTADLAAAGRNIIVAFPGEGGIADRKQPTALLLRGSKVVFGVDAVKAAQLGRVPPGGAALYKTFKLGLSLEKRGAIRTVDALANKMVAATATLPKDAPAASARLVDLITLALKAALDRISSMLAHAQMDKAARGEAFVVHYVLTVPAGWDDIAKAVMRRAAESAGMPAEHTSFAFEPECAVLSAMSNPHAVLPPLGSNVAIVDAGGGTTDCIVSTLEKGPVLKEVVPGFCAEVGGSAVDRAFEALLGGVFGRDRPAPANLWDRASASSVVRVLSHFEDDAKCRVTPGCGPLIVSVAPIILSLNQNSVTDAEIAASLAAFNSHSARVGLPPVVLDSGDLIIPDPEQLFRPALQEIVDVYRSHVDCIANSDRPSSILLVGGFSASKVLQARLEAEFAGTGVSVIAILDAWQAVVKGAVLSALKPRSFARRMRHAYGFSVGEPWDAALHGSPAPPIDHAGDVPRVSVLQRIVHIGEKVAEDDQQIGGVYLAPVASSRRITLSVFRLGRADIPAGTDFEDISDSPRARRWVPWNCPLTVVPLVVPRTAVKMDLEVPLPPLPPGVQKDNRWLEVWAKFGGTEFTVRVDVFVDKIKVPEFSKQIPIVYGDDLEPAAAVVGAARSGKPEAASSAASDYL